MESQWSPTGLPTTPHQREISLHNKVDYLFLPYHFIVVKRQALPNYLDRSLVGPDDCRVLSLWTCNKRYSGSLYTPLIMHTRD